MRPRGRAPTPGAALNSLAKKENLRSIYAMLIAVAMFSLMDTSMKILSARYPAMQVTALRALSSLPLTCAYIAYRGAFGRLLKVRWPLHLLRGVLGVSMLTLFAYGLQKLSLAETYSLFFIAPTLITALSVWFLKERVDGAQWGAIMVGLAGVIVVLRPDGAHFFSLGGLAVLGSAACYAISAIASRILSRTDSSEQIMFWLMVMMAVAGVTLSAHEWVALRAEYMWVIAALAVSGFLGQLAITVAFRPARRRPWRRSNIRRWPGAWRSTGCCGTRCPTSTRCSARPSSSPAACIWCGARRCMSRPSIRRRDGPAP